MCVCVCVCVYFETLTATPAWLLESALDQKLSNDWIKVCGVYTSVRTLAAHSTDSTAKSINSPSFTLSCVEASWCEKNTLTITSTIKITPQVFRTLPISQCTKVRDVVVYIGCD
eukprot:GHVR01055386.1.p1 GENE.GHVR01055386.1~~GHVR01055386.1.p1  ORF type:complete len:114 (+),score=21.60 GHVR01055386.1:66-407(+)